VRKKSLALSALFIDRVDAECGGLGLILASPSRGAERGSQICYAHPEGYAIMQALIARGVIGDFRAPDILRFGFTPLYTRFVDVWDAVATLRAVLATRQWDRPEFKQRSAVT
jgi:kynureninase